MSSQSLYASENPLIVGSNVTLYSTVANVTNGIWLFNNDVIVLIVGSEIIINNNWLEMVTYIPTPPTLTIRSLQLRDSGLYTLNALNFFTVQLTLSVQGKDHFITSHVYPLTQIRPHILQMKCGLSQVTIQKTTISS